MIKIKKIKNRFYKIQRNLKSGFTLIEMIIVVGIFGVLTAITVYDYSSFNNSILLTNLTYEVALEIRQSQVYSLGVRSSGIGGGDSGRDDFDTRFGTFFNTDDTTESFFTFADNNRSGSQVGRCEDTEDGECTVVSCIDGHDECLSIVSLSRGIEFSSDLCVSDEGDDPVDLGTGICSGDATAVDWLGITFSRPNPEALIKTSENTNENPIVADQNAGIILEANNGAKRAIIIRSTGQITVEYINN